MAVSKPKTGQKQGKGKGDALRHLDAMPTPEYPPRDMAGVRARLAGRVFTLRTMANWLRREIDATAEADADGALSRLLEAVESQQAVDSEEAAALAERARYIVGYGVDPKRQPRSFSAGAYAPEMRADVSTASAPDVAVFVSPVTPKEGD